MGGSGRGVIECLGKELIEGRAGGEFIRFYKIGRKTLATRVRTTEHVTTPSDKLMNLALIQAYDTPGLRRWRTCGKLAVSSLLRGVWGGQVRLVRNFEQPLFPTGRQGLLERINVGFDHHNRLLGWQREADLGEEIGRAGLRGESWQRQVAKEASRLLQFEEVARLEDPEVFEWVLLMDADCVVLRNPDHLLDRDEDVLVTHLKSPDPGVVAIRGGRVKELALRWQQQRVARRGWDGGHGQDLAAALGSGGWRVGRFEGGEVLRADAPGVGLAELKDAAVVHFGGLEPRDKQRLAFGFHLMTVYGDEDGLFLDLLEA